MASPAEKQPMIPSPLRVAIIGGGPAGLGAAIALSHLPDTDVTIYEKATQLREVGAGIRIGYNCWRVLELLGAAQDVRGHRKEQVLHRNGMDGRVLVETDNTVHDGAAVPRRYQPLRVRRTRLQAALVRRVKDGVVRLGREVVGLERVDAGVGGDSRTVARLRFADGEEVVADLVVGGDGIRSVVREALFPEHSIRFTGTSIFRTLIPIGSVKHIPDIAEGTSWWHGSDGHVYLSPVDDPEDVPDEKDRMFEISCRRTLDPSGQEGKVFSWGVPVTKERVDSHFTVRRILSGPFVRRRH